MPRILFVEDETSVLDVYERFFTKEGYQCYGASSRSEAIAVAERYPPDVAILDVMLNEGPEPSYDGYAVCKALRDRGYEGPVIFLTARTSEQDKLKGFELGADDYVTKPASLLELKARIAVVLRRSGGARSVYRFGTVEVDLDNFIIRHSDDYGDKRLSNKELELLRYLIENPNKVIKRIELLQTVWEYSKNASSRTVDTHILNVRKKLNDNAANPRFIETIHGAGYRFIGVEG